MKPQDEFSKAEKFRFSLQLFLSISLTILITLLVIFISEWLFINKYVVNEFTSQLYDFVNFNSFFIRFYYIIIVALYFIAKLHLAAGTLKGMSLNNHNNTLLLLFFLPSIYFIMSDVNNMFSYKSYDFDFLYPILVLTIPMSGYVIYRKFLDNFLLKKRD